VPLKEEQKRFFVETFGCQMNVNDSEKVAGLLLADGHVRAEGPGDADFVFINTCAVREVEKLYSPRASARPARDKARSAWRGGCVAQLHGEEILKRAPEIACWWEL
jgi:tRNA-2-methylthio-N6-dimethylallyladenosine synthase